MAKRRRTARTTGGSRRRPEAPGPRVVPRSGRHTPATPSFRLRPSWHRIIGWVGVGSGVLVIGLNDLMLMGDGLRLLPFGHSELYLMLGVIVSGSSSWFLGLFDRGTTIYG